MSDNKVNGFMGTTFDKLKTMVDVNTTMGDPITTADGTVIIPVNKVSYGFGAGGSDLPSKNASALFGGGSGGAVTITPVAFLIVKDGTVKVTQIEPFTSPLDRAIQTAPDVVDKISSIAENFKSGLDSKKQDKE
ncbi:MAG: spore germination protein GerW family protein [Clostridia bacterium]